MKMNKEKILFHAIYVMAIVMLLFGDLYSQKNECIDYHLNEEGRYLEGKFYKVMIIGLFSCENEKINNQNELKIDLKVDVSNLKQEIFTPYLDTSNVIVNLDLYPMEDADGYATYRPFYTLPIPLKLIPETIGKDCIYVVNIKIYKELTNKIMKQLQIQFYERG